MASQLKQHIMERMLLFILTSRFVIYLYSLFSRVYFEFILNQDKPTEIKYEFSPSEPFHGPIEYHKSYLKVNKNIFLLQYFSYLSI